MSYENDENDEINGGNPSTSQGSADNPTINETDPSPQEVILSFRFRSRKCVLSTTWWFPLTCPSATIAIFNTAAFEIPGGKTVLVDLLYALESEFPDWSERRVPKGMPVGSAGVAVAEDSLVFSITKIASTRLLHLANGLFIEAAIALVRLGAMMSLARRSPLTIPAVNRECLTGNMVGCDNLATIEN